MREDLLIRRLREAIRKGAKVPPEVKFRELVEAGIIDEKGRVIVRMPEPPKMGKPKKRPKPDSPAPAQSSATDGALNGEACFLSEDALLRRMEQAIRKGAKVPPEVKFRELVEAGIIDEKG